MEVIYALLHQALAVVIGVLVALGSFFTGHTETAHAPLPVPAATTTATASFPVASSAPKTIATSTPAKNPPQKSSDLLSEPKAAGSAGQTFAPDSLPTFSTEQLNTLARGALVNILCTTLSGGSFNPISGSGVVVDSRGVILTNAHVAQYFLLRDYPTTNSIDCVVRTGSPAQPRYRAELLYLPPTWVVANAAQIKKDTPTGTGEFDYAFLRITGSTNPQGTIPSSFAALPMESGDPYVQQRILLAAYPAGFLGGIAISLNLYPTSALATVGDVYTFGGETNIDLFSLGGTVVAQTGSSGGAAVSAQGKLIGLIATEVPGATTAERDLRAITMAHIDRSLRAAGQGGILTLLSRDVVQFAAEFNAATAPIETRLLLDALTK